MDIYLLFLISAIIYLSRTILFKFGNKLEEANNLNIINYDFVPFVSIVVPARNEENNIAHCLISLSKSQYPIDKYEIVIVNDRSSDNTLEVINSLKFQIPNLKIVNITDDSQKGNLRGKPGASQAGIDVADGEFILMTDADCFVPKTWVRRVVNEFQNPNTHLVCSYTTVDGKNPFEIVQSVEWIYSNTLARGGVGLGKVIGCFGNNLSVRKSTFEKLGGYRKIPFTVTEDLSLMKAIDESNFDESNINKNKSKIRYICDTMAVIETSPCKTFAEYIEQHKRWAMGGRALGWKAFVLVFTSLSLWAGIFLSLINFKFHLAALLITLRVVCDIWIILPTLNKIKYTYLKSWLVPSIMFFMLIELIIPFTLFSNKIVWKNQVFKR